MRAALAALTIAVALLPIACSPRATAPTGGQEATPPAQPAAPPQTAAQAPSAPATSNAAVATASPAPSASVAQAPAPVTSGPTPGFAYCGVRPCDLKSEFCFIAEGRPGVCKPRSELERFHAGSGMQDKVLECDDVSDCPAGQRCCMGAYFGGTGPVSQLCDAKQCLAQEACVPGSACAAGNACKIAQAEPARGLCAPANLAVACGKATCSGDTPVCCWDPNKKTGTCVPPADSGGYDKCQLPAMNLLACRNRADCGGQFCCFDPNRGSSCWGACGGSSDTVLCNTFADCPKEEVMGSAGPMKFKRCNKSGALGYCQ